MASALLECPDLISSYSHSLNSFIGLRPESELGVVLANALNVSSFLKISSKNGLNNPSETTANKDERILKEK